MGGIPIKILDMNGLSYIYGKLGARINSFTDASQTEIDTFKANAQQDINAAVANANAKATAAESAANAANEFIYGAESDFATKTELNAAISGITSFEMTVVSALPPTGVKGTIYLIMASDGSGNDVYDEYIWIPDSSKFEKIGTTRVDLTPYATSADVANTYSTKAESAATYLSKTDASSTYLSKADASSTYATIANVYNEYLQKTDAANTYIDKSSYNEKIAALEKADSDNLAAAKSDALANYLQKSTAASTYATKTDLSNLQNAVSGITSFEMTVVSALPSTGVKGTIYLINASDGSGNDVYDEYIWIPGSSKFEKIGTTRVDLTPYAKSADVASTYLSKTDAASNYLGKTATAAAATRLATARTITLSNAVTGSVSFDGSANVTITTKVNKGTSVPSSLADGSVYFVYE